jgi:hypothetical protein
MTSTARWRTVKKRIIYPYPTQAAAIKMASDFYNMTRLTPIRWWIFRSWLAC